MRRAFLAGIGPIAAGFVASGGMGASPGALTINVSPNPTVTGDSILVYGHLHAASPADESVTLHARVAPATTFTVAPQTASVSGGFYEFSLSSSESTANASFFVTAPGGLRSRTVREHVSAALTISAAAATGETFQALTFSGAVVPSGHSGEQVSLQQAGPDGNWRTVAQGPIDSSGNYSISHAFARAGFFNVRALLAGDAENTKAVSDPIAFSVQQAQNVGFTIQPSDPQIVVGQSVTISGVVYAPGSTTTPAAGESVTLWGHEAGRPDVAIATTVTGSDGSYSFTQEPIHNETYDVRSTLGHPAARTTLLYESVDPTLSVSASATTAVVGGKAQLTGTVTPDAAGKTVNLERLGPDGAFHLVKTGTVVVGSVFSFVLVFGSAGTKTFRVTVPGGSGNAVGNSPEVSISVSVPPLASLPGA